MKNYIVINDMKIPLTDEQIRDITAAYNAQGIKLHDVPTGSTFKLGDHEFVVLEQFADVAAVIRKEPLPARCTFGENNNYDGSNPDRLCCEFAEELIAAVGIENVMTHVVDLTADDGLKDYGTVERAVSLLTAGEYRHYVEILDKFKPNSWWWLATPHSTAAHENADWVKCVSPSGYFYYDCCNYSDLGVRPFCILKSNIFVSI